MLVILLTLVAKFMLQRHFSAEFFAFRIVTWIPKEIHAVTLRVKYPIREAWIYLDLSLGLAMST